MTPPRLEMRGVRKRFGATLALDGVDLQVAAGEVHALVGQNGAGKSTLMKVLSGAHAPDEGTLALDGTPYRPRDPLEARRLGVAMIYQELSLARHLTVEENIVLGMEPSRWGVVDRREMRRRTVEALGQLQHPDIPPDAPAGSLSVAQQQIVEIARALATGCRVLVLDEPTSSITLKDSERLFQIIAGLREQGHAIVYISHFIEECRRVAQRYTVLRDGRTAGTGRMADATTPGIVDLMVGRRVEQLYPRSRRAPGEVVLSVSGLNADFELRRGEVLGIAGLVGAGRTELLRAIFGLDPVRRGEVRVGAWTGAATPSLRWRQGAGFVSEDRKNEGLALGLSVTDNLTLTRMPRVVLPSRHAADAARWIEKLSLTCAGPGQRTVELSGGNQQKVALARLLHHDADVWLLDEPTRGIDVGSKAQVYALIDDLVSRASPPRAVLLVSSYLPELLGVCDRIAVMHRGTLGPARPVEGLDERGLLLDATGQEDAA